MPRWVGAHRELRVSPQVGGDGRAFARRTDMAAGEREDWWVDPEAAVGAELGAAQGVSAWLVGAGAGPSRGGAGRSAAEGGRAVCGGCDSELVVRAIEW
jgi:hypothetical protein